MAKNLIQAPAIHLADANKKGPRKRQRTKFSPCGCSKNIKRYRPNRKPKQTTETTNVIKICSASTTKCFSIQILIQGQMILGLVDSGNGLYLIS